jgi:hypothetical protein
MDLTTFEEAKKLRGSGRPVGDKPRIVASRKYFVLYLPQTALHAAGLVGVARVAMYYSRELQQIALRPGDTVKLTRSKSGAVNVAVTDAVRSLGWGAGQCEYHVDGEWLVLEWPAEKADADGPTP